MKQQLAARLVSISLVLANWAVASGCSKSASPPASNVRLSPTRGTVPAPAKAGGTGVAECDRYFEMWQSCISTKVPSEERATEQEGLDSEKSHVKIAASLFGAMDFPEACAKSTRALKRNDLFECYGGKHSCSYVSKAEMEQLLGSSVGDVTLGRQGCRYVPSDQPIGGTVVKVEWSDGAKEDMQAARMGMQLTDKLLQASSGSSLFPVDTLRGVGDEAFFAGLGTLYVRKGEALVTIDGMTASQDQKVAIARLLLGRL